MRLSVVSVRISVDILSYLNFLIFFSVFLNFLKNYSKINNNQQIRKLTFQNELEHISNNLYLVIIRALLLVDICVQI